MKSKIKRKLKKRLFKLNFTLTQSCRLEQVSNISPSTVVNIEYFLNPNGSFIFGEISKLKFLINMANPSLT